MFLVKSRKSLLRLQILIQRQRMLPVDIDLPVVRECDSKVGIAECNDLLVGSRCLMFKLVARKIQNLKSLRTVLLVNTLQFIVLRRKSAFGRRVDYQDNLSLSSVCCYCSIHPFTHASSSGFGMNPTFLPTTLPSFKNKSAGMFVMPFAIASCVFSSVSAL